MPIFVHEIFIENVVSDEKLKTATYCRDVSSHIPLLQRLTNILLSFHTDKPKDRGDFFIQYDDKTNAETRLVYAHTVWGYLPFLWLFDRSKQGTHYINSPPYGIMEGKLKIVNKTQNVKVCNRKEPDVFFSLQRILIDFA
jgi:hypothetical protein